MNAVVEVLNAELQIAGRVPLDVRHIEIVERLSRPFEVTVRVLSEDPSIDFESVVGADATLKVYSVSPHAERSWVGVVSHAEQERAVSRGSGAELSTYVFRLSPSLWLATLRKTSRVFQHMSIPDIVDQVMQPYRANAEWRVARASYPKLWLRTQYGESDFDFVSRLLEEAGIAYAFVDGKMILGDDLCQAAFTDRGSLTYHHQIESPMQTPHARDARLKTEPRPTEHLSMDYDHRRPTFDLLTQSSAGRTPKLEQYDYVPGGFLIEKANADDGQTPVADDKARARHDMDFGMARNKRALEADRAGRVHATFRSNQIELSAGSSVTLDGHPHAAFGTKLLVVETRIETTEYPGVAITHHAHFTNDPHRPLRRTQKPRVSGVQSATVVGPDHEEIHTDEFGRVRVHFPWDREGERDDSALCWVRVSEGWSGAGYGMIALPRVGQEVLVAFIDGDPDHPVVVGRLHNELNPVPYRLPEFRTVSAWRTSSSPRTNGGYNEIKMEDNAGQEYIYTRAQRDHHRLVLRDDRTRTGRLLHHTVVSDEHRVSLADKKELVVGTSHVHVQTDLLQKVGSHASLVVGVDSDTKIGNKLAMEAGREIHVKSGDKIVIEAGARITLKAPGGFIDINEAGIDIVGDLVRINSGGAPAMGSGASPKDPTDAEEAVPQDVSQA